MSPVGDKIGGIAKTLKTNLGLVLIVCMGLCLAFIGFFQLNESQTMSFEPAPPVSTEPKISIDRTSPEYLAVITLDDSLQTFEDSPYRILVDFNMFDPKSEKDSSQLQQDADRLVEQGRKALSEGNFKDAEDLANQALRVLPSHKGAKDLLAEIKIKKAEAAAAANATKTAKPGPKTPAAAPKAPAPGAK